MDASLLLQYAVIVIAAVVSAWVVAKKQFPGGVRRLRVALALPMLREGRAAWLRALGRRIAPEARAAASGCGGCDTCK